MHMNEWMAPSIPSSFHMSMIRDYMIDINIKTIICKQKCITYLLNNIQLENRFFCTRSISFYHRIELKNTKDKAKQQQKKRTKLKKIKWKMKMEWTWTERQPLVYFPFVNQTKYNFSLFEGIAAVNCHNTTYPYRWFWAMAMCLHLNCLSTQFSKIASTVKKEIRVNK